MGVFAMLTGNGLSEQRYIDNLLLECGEGTTLIPKKEVFYPEGDATLDFISYYPYQQPEWAEAVLYCMSQYRRIRANPPITAYPIS